MNLSRGKKTTALVVVLLLGLAVLGVAYAQWQKTLTINGTVNTADVDAQWIMTENGNIVTWCNDEGTTNDPGQPVPKHVGSTEIGLDPSDDQILLVTVDNVYPSYRSTCWAKLHNDGTIPVKIQSIGCPSAPAWLTVSLQNNLGAVIPPSGKESTTMILHVEDDAPEGTSGASFACEVELVPWNDP
jgi:hypothetical protein